MNTKLITTKSGKSIFVYDNLFTYNERIRFYQFMRSSSFRIHNSDGINAYLRNQFYSQYSVQDVDNLGIKDTEGYKRLDTIHKFSQRDLIQSRVNCTTPHEQCGYHIDYSKGSSTFLYYGNLKWDLTWSGQTIFGSEDLNEIEYASFFIPGRVIVFDGSIPHMIVPPNMYAEEVRLSFSIQHKQIKKESI